MKRSPRALAYPTVKSMIDRFTTVQVLAKCAPGAASASLGPSGAAKVSLWGRCSYRRLRGQAGSKLFLRPSWRRQLALCA
mmetsp:Transcript_43871/g.59515  ORF Transcript_43871/g.59515 Transcript_43871/m.59515 type:complete len:80 (-) Transcript_43871:348-587(-)